MSFLVSVVVPTKNRYKYLKHLIKLIDSFHLSELEFVIQDNSDDNTEIWEYLKEYENPSIKYYHTSDTLTMSQNGEQAILHASGEYVCYIGDDDGVCRNIVDCVRWMKANDVDVAYNKNVWFLWGRAAKLHKKEKDYTFFNAHKELKQLAKNGCDMAGANIPLLYHGIVKKTILEGLIKRYGTLFPCVPPDIAGSICLATVTKRFCELHNPVIINGISKMSGGGVLDKGGVLNLQDVAFITLKEIEEWEKRIPPIWCGHYAWANSGIKALEFVGLSELSQRVDVDYCLAKAVSQRPQKMVLWQKGFEYANSKIKFLFLAVFGIFQTYILKFKNNNPWSVKELKGISDIVEAESFFISNAKKFLTD